MTPSPNPKITDESTVESSQSRVVFRANEQAGRDATLMQLHADHGVSSESQPSRL